MRAKPTGTARPSKEERHESRRSEIVDAAKACVVGHGFHAASMAQIASTAKMSVGQVYRYFPHKEAIIEAIVERIVNRKLQWMVDEPRAPLDLHLLATRIVQEDPSERDDRILLLEVNAEATRNPVVADIVREADARIHRKAEAHVAITFPTMSKDEIRARVELIAVLLEGASFRRETRRVVDRATLTALYRDVIDRAFSPPRADRTRPKSTRNR